MSEPRLSYLRVIRLSVPVMMAQAAIAATGVVDTAVMGLAGTKADLAAIAIASSIFSFLYWGFGFLRMSTTGLVAQAQGRGDVSAARAVVQRALCLGLALGLLLLVVAPFARTAVFFPFGATASPGTFGGLGAGSTMFCVDPERDLVFVCLTAGVLEDSRHFERMALLSDLALAAVAD